MAGFLNAVSAVFVIFLLMSVGYGLGHIGWLTTSEKKFISKFVINVAVPLNCVVSVLNNFTREDLLGAGWKLLAAWLVVLVSLLLSAGIATMLKLPKNRWFIVDLVGLKVVDTEGNELGTLKEVLQPGATDVYSVVGPRSFLFPALKRVIKNVDIEAGLMVLDAAALQEVAVYDD